MPDRKKRIPELRFPEFKDAGEWEEVLLGKIGEFTGGGTPSKSNETYWTGSIPWISSSDISDDSITAVTISRFISEEALQDSATKLIPKNSILLVSRVGVGKLAISQQELCTSQDFTNFTPAKDNFVFLAYYLKTLNSILLGFSQGMAIKGFTKEDISNLPILLPSLPEQKKIADCLSSLDELITNQAKKVEALNLHKKGLMQKLFPVAGERIPRLRFPEFQNAEEWEVKILGEVCDILQGYGFPESLQGKKQGKYPFYKVSDISRAVNEQGGLLDSSANYIDDDELIELKATLIPRNVTVFAKIGEALRLNRRAITQVNCLVDNNVAGLKAKKNIALDRFIFNIAELIDLNEYCGGAVPSVNKTTLGEIEVLLPSLPEQEKIAECLSSLDDLITGETKKLTNLRQHKKGLMQKLFPRG